MALTHYVVADGGGWGWGGRAGGKEGGREGEGWLAQGSKLGGWFCKETGPLMPPLLWAVSFLWVWINPFTTAAPGPFWGRP